MKKRILILVIVIPSTGIAAFFIWTAQLARKKSDDLMAAFKKVDSSIVVSNDSLTHAKEGIGAIERDSSYMPAVDLSFKVNRICVRIDSIKNDLRLLKDKNKSPFSYENKDRIMALKTDLLAFNMLIEKYFSDNPKIKAGDLIKVADIKKGDISIPWEVYYFDNTTAHSLSKALTATKQQVLNIEEKAFQND